MERIFGSYPDYRNYRRTGPSVILLKKHAAKKLFKRSRNCSKIKTVTNSQTKALFCSFYAWFLANE